MLGGLASWLLDLVHPGVCLLCPQLFVVELIPDGAMKARRLEKY